MGKILFLFIPHNGPYIKTKIIDYFIKKSVIKITKTKKSILMNVTKYAEMILNYFFTFNYYYILIFRTVFSNVTCKSFCTYYFGLLIFYAH